MEVTLRMIVTMMLLVVMALLAGSMAIDQNETANDAADTQTNYAKCQLWISRTDCLEKTSDGVEKICSDEWADKYEANCN